MDRLFDLPSPDAQRRPIGEPPRRGASPTSAPAGAASNGPPPGGEGDAAREGAPGPTVPASVPAPSPRHLARTNDPDTSVAAAQRVKVTEQMLQVLAAYRDGVELLDEQAYERVGFSAAHHARQRCSDLRRAGLIGRVGRTARTVSGRSGHLCRITEAGAAVLDSREIHRPSAA